MQDKITYFKNHAQEIIDYYPEITQVYLIKSKVSDDWGTMSIDTSDSHAKIENHCQQCFEEFYPFRMGPLPDFPYHSLSLTASPKKLNSILSGEIKFAERLELCELLVERK